MGVIESLLKKEDVTAVEWVGPSIEDCGWGNCSRNSTAVVALHGIKRGVSSLGDDLVEAYENTVKFIEEHNPNGVRKFERFHLCDVLSDGPKTESYQKLSQRFGNVQELEVMGKFHFGVREEAYVFNPLLFMNWWSDRLLENSKVSSVEDYIVSIDAEASKAFGLKENYQFQKIYDCRGASIKDAGFEKVKKTPGNYLTWEIPQLSEDIVLTVNGHNLILDSERKVAILGGTNEANEIEAPAIGKLEVQRDSFTRLIPELEVVLDIEKANLSVGVRPKGPKRQPFITEVSKNHIVVNGFYKNGYSLCHLFGKRAVK